MSASVSSGKVNAPNGDDASALCTPSHSAGAGAQAAAEHMLPAVIANMARRAPDTAFIDEVDGRSATYGEVHELAMRWAAAFERIGIKAGDRVATMLPADINTVGIWLGLSWLKAIEVPLNPAYRGDMLEHAIALIKPRVLLAMPGTEADLGTCPAIADVECIVFRSEPEAIPDALVGRVEDMDSFLAHVVTDPSAEREPPAPWDTSCIIFTSGTTGASKGVIIPWGMLHAAAHAAFSLNRVADDEIYYAALPFHHILGRHCLYQMALTGRRVVMRTGFSATDFWSDVRRFGATMAFVFGLPLYRQQPAADDAENPLRTVFMAPLIPEFEDFDRRFGVHTETLFGMTELGVGFTSGPDIPNSRTIGRVATGPAGLEVRLVDEHDYEVPVGQVGELIVRTRQPWALNGGYFGMPAETARAWRNGWFHTGDGFRCDEDGNFYFVERLKDYIRRRGENISAFEVEMAVNGHPDVLESAAIAVPSFTGEDEVKICVVLNPGASVTEAELSAHVTSRLPAYMVPRYIEFMESLPRTPTHKIRKVELRESPFNERTWDRLTNMEGTR